MMTVEQVKQYEKFIEDSLEEYANDPNPLNKQFNENMIKHNKAKLETIKFILNANEREV